MSDHRFVWDTSGDATQVFDFGNIQRSNMNSVYDSTYTVTGFVPGVPYKISATATNVRTDESSVFAVNEGDAVWFESNIDTISFDKEMAQGVDITVDTVLDTEISIRVSHALDGYGEEIDKYTIRYDFFAEANDEVHSISTYVLSTSETEQEFPFVGLSPNTSYDVFYSIVVNPNNGHQDGWYYVCSHKWLSSIHTTATRTIHFDQPELEQLFNATI
jgi:hypothetical protein